jgi:hypothetical protein
MSEDSGCPTRPSAIAQRIFPVRPLGSLLFLQTTSRPTDRRRAIEKVTETATKCTAQFFQHISPIHSRPIVVKPKQGWIRDTRLLPQAVKGPMFALEDLRKPANNHGTSLAAAAPVCKASIICNVFFTYMTGLSNVTCSCESIIAVAAGPPGDCHFSQVFALRIQR